MDRRVCGVGYIYSVWTCYAGLRIDRFPGSDRQSLFLFNRCALQKHTLSKICRRLVRGKFQNADSIYRRILNFKHTSVPLHKTVEC